MKEIPLTQGKVTLVDDEDYEFLVQWPWRLLWNGQHLAACASRVIHFKRKTRTIRMHRVILGLQNPETGEQLSPQQVDHRDGDPLNNRRENLRAATRGQNNSNAKKRTGSISSFKGVTRPINKKRWLARCGHSYLGYFDTEEEAAQAYDGAARAAYREFARVNFPREGEQQA